MVLQKGPTICSWGWEKITPPPLHPATVYMYIHAYILYLSLLSKLWLPTCLKQTNSISVPRNLTVDHTNRCVEMMSFVALLSHSMMGLLN